MNAPLGRNGLIGLAVGATVGLGLIAFIVHREIKRRKYRRMVLEAQPFTRLFDAADGAVLLLETHDAQGRGSQCAAWHWCVCLCVCVSGYSVRLS